VTLENLLGFPEKDLEFHIWYLKEKGWIERVDTGGYAVTVAGVEAVIEKDLLLRKDRYLTDGSEPLPRTESAKELDPADRSLTSALGESGS
jgi:hypothetical protein